MSNITPPKMSYVIMRSFFGANENGQTDRIIKPYLVYTNEKIAYQKLEELIGRSVPIEDKFWICVTMRGK